MSLRRKKLKRIRWINRKRDFVSFEEVLKWELGKVKHWPCKTRTLPKNWKQSEYQYGWEVI